MKVRIKELRKGLGLTQTAFAKRAGLSQTQIKGYENGSFYPTLPALEQLAETYQVHPAWLVGWIDERDGLPKTKEKIVRVTEHVGRIPTYWKNDEAGKLIRWTKRGIPVE